MIMKPSMDLNMASNTVKANIFDSESCTMYDIRTYKDVNPAIAVIVMTVIILDISIVNVINFC